MSNMSYCRFTNTLEALRDCADALESGDFRDSSREELRAAKRLIQLCMDLVGVDDGGSCADEYLEQIAKAMEQAS